MIVTSSEEPGDAAAIHAVHLAAFPTAVEADLVDALRANGRAVISLVARIEREIVGHILFSPVTIDGAHGGLGLAPVAVLPAHQRRGIGGALVRAGLAACRARGVPYVVVLGEPAYYQRFGFTRASAAGVTNEYGVDAELMIIALHGEPPRGLVQYCEELRAV